MSSLDNLRKAASRWHKALRANDPEARARLLRAWPDAPAHPVLRDVQHALARERGLASWIALTQALAASPTAAPAAPPDRAHEERVARFLELACWDTHVHGRGDHARNERAALRLLARHPEIARASLYTAVVCGELAHVERILAERPQAASEPGGARGWVPLLYLCFARLSHPATTEHAVAIARALLDRGADPNAFHFAGAARYTALVGAAGEGEQDSPPQPQRRASFQLLLERGARPFDIQVLYNTHFHGDVLWWLELVWAQTTRSHAAAWADPDWSMLDMEAYGPGAHFLLKVAVEHDDLALAEWLLAHGASPQATSSHPQFRPRRTLEEEARCQGLTAMADLLVRHGAKATRPALDGEEAFLAACFRLDREAARTHLVRHPEYLQSPLTIFAACRRDRADVVALLLDLGVSIELQDGQRQRPLHEASGHDARRVAALLIDRGAQVDPREANWGATPLGFAAYGCNQAMIDLLSRVSRDVWSLTSTGCVERLRTVLHEQPELARTVNSDGSTPLSWLPDDESKALAIVELFLAHGADPAQRSRDGTTAADAARRRGLEAAAARLAVPGAEKPPAPATPALERFEALARDLLFAFESGHADAMRRLQEHQGRSFTWDELRAATASRLAAVTVALRPPDYFALPHARLLVAREAGFADWAALVAALSARGSSAAGGQEPPPATT